MRGFLVGEWPLLSRLRNLRDVARLPRTPSMPFLSVTPSHRTTRLFLRTCTLGSSFHGETDKGLVAVNICFGWTLQGPVFGTNSSITQAESHLCILRTNVGIDKYTSAA